MKVSLFRYILFFIALVYAIHTSAQENIEQIQDHSEEKLFDFNHLMNKPLYPILNGKSDIFIFERPNQLFPINYNTFTINHISWDKTDRFAMDRNELQHSFRPKFYSNLNRKDNFFPGVTSEQINFFAESYDANLGFEGASSLGLGMEWKPTDNFTFSTKPFVTSYFLPFDNARRVSAGLNTMLIYQVSNWLIIRTYGQYATNGTKLMNTFVAPQNSFGGDVLFKFSNNFGLGGGVKYVNQGGKWTPQYYPLIYISPTKNVKKLLKFN